MLRMIILIVSAAALVAGGWILGSVYPAPTMLTDKVRQEARDLITLARINAQEFRSQKDKLSPEELAQVTDNAAAIAADSGKAVVVERDAAGETDDQSGFTLASSTVPEKTVATPSTPSTPAGAKPTPTPATGTEIVTTDPTRFDQVRLCPKMTVSNRPATQPNGVLVGDTRRIVVQGVTLMLNPTQGACLASGVGPRGGKIHRGVDYYAPESVDVAAGGDGVVIEKKYRPDYGNMILIDHGGGVYTRYAHLASFDRSIAVGAKVKLNQRIGLMGNTADYRIPIHLHYELLLGDYNNPKGSFGLTATSPFDYAGKKG
ncbi:MAG: peptidoglycan DD-metalloendopeptidase family protein [Alphaproteobacteria bacterium]|nr:peptidoglycan DD-metalloendopeptidase family protein [Alphaproteobacteria bacterium]